MADKPRSLTALQENAAKLFVEGHTQADAYRKAGYKVDKCTDKSIHELASRVFADVRVSSRVKELQAEAQQRHDVTIDSLTKELDEAKRFAYGVEQTSAAVSAIMGKAKIHGFDKQVIDANIKTIVKIVDLSGKEDE